MLILLVPNSIAYIWNSRSLVGWSLSPSVSVCMYTILCMFPPFPSVDTYHSIGVDTYIKFQDPFSLPATHQVLLSILINLSCYMEMGFYLLWKMTFPLIIFEPLPNFKEVRLEVRLVLPERPESHGLADTLLPDSHHPLVLRPAHIRLTTPRYYQIQPCPAQARVEHSHWSRDIELM